MHRTLWLGLLLVACSDTASNGGDDGGGGGGDDTTPATQDTAASTTGGGGGGACTTGVTWKGGNSEDERMHPGRACFSCHAGGEGPLGGVAGTVYTGAHEPNDCYGEAGIKVEIIGNDDVVTTYTTNEAGNFITRRRDPIVFPIRARVVVGDQVHEMLTPQDSGDCNSCHSQKGANAAPGRIQLP